MELTRLNFLFCFIYLFLRKISPELTSAANPPLFAMENWSWAKSMPIFLYFICGMPATAWHAKRCHVHTQDPNWQTPGRWSGTWALNCCTTALAVAFTLISCLESDLLVPLSLNTKNAMWKDKKSNNTKERQRDMKDRVRSSTNI